MRIHRRRVRRKTLKAVIVIVPVVVIAIIVVYTYFMSPSKAFAYHPLFWLVPIAVIVLLCKSKINIKIYKIIIFTIIIMFAIVYMCRLIWSGDDVVVFEPENNILFRIIRIINSK